MSIEGTIPASEHDLDLSMRMGQHSDTFDFDNASLSVVSNFEHRVFVLILKERDSGRETEMYAVPSSMRVNQRAGAVNARFTAHITTVKPGLRGKDTHYNDYLRELRLQCRYDYAI